MIIVRNVLRCFISNKIHVQKPGKKGIRVRVDLCFSPPSLSFTNVPNYD